MIKTQNLTPEIYYKESRDFQLFGRIYDIIFNYVKTNVDLMENFPINQYTDSKLIELLSRTLGFNNRSDYRNDDLNAICSVFIHLIKNKGTLQSIKDLVRTILNIEGINKPFDVTLSDTLPRTVLINIPDVTTNPEIKLLEDVLDYIIPIGICYNIKTTNILSSEPGKVEVASYLEASKLIDGEGNYSNLNLTEDPTQFMALSDTVPSAENPIGNVGVPIVGDLRYTKVTERLKKEEE